MTAYAYFQFPYVATPTMYKYITIKFSYYKLRLELSLVSIARSQYHLFDSPYGA